MQQNELIITRPEQARALQDTGFLGRFLEPASPSDVARSLGMPANLAHHHARRHAGLGLLNLVRREGGKVYYQLAARTFKHDRALLPVGDPDEQTAVAFELLRKRFLSAYEACDREQVGEDPNWHIYEFDRRARPAEPPTNGTESAGALRPAHFQARTLALSPQGYQKLVRRITRLVTETEAEEGLRAAPCTLAFVAMDGVFMDGAVDSQYTSTFVPQGAPDGHLESDG